MVEEDRKPQRGSGPMLQCVTDLQGGRQAKRGLERVLLHGLHYRDPRGSVAMKACLQSIMGDR